MRLGSAALAAVVVAVLLAPAASAASPALEVAKPRPDQLVTGKRVTVVLHTAPKLRKLEVSLRGRGYTGPFSKVRAGANVIVAADVPRHRVAPRLQLSDHWPSRDSGDRVGKPKEGGAR